MRFILKNLGLILTVFLILNVIVVANAWGEMPLTDDEILQLQDKKQKLKERLEFELNELRFGRVRGLRYFSHVQVSLLGSAEKIGLKHKTLEDYLKLKFLNNFAFMQDHINSSEEFKIEDFKEEGRAFILCRVWTVGEDYPIALHIECSATQLNPGKRVWINSVLGFGGKGNIENQVKETFSAFMEEFSILVLKAIGKM